MIEKEKEAFIEWRRSLSDLESNEHLCLTPFEKNLEVWRQLWRVVERSEVVVQVSSQENEMMSFLFVFSISEKCAEVSFATTS